MTRITALTLCIASLLLTACGGDYEANPIVIQDGGETIVVDEHNGTEEVIITDDFIQNQLIALQASIWQSACINGQIIELTFSETEQTALLFQFADADCGESTTNPAQLSVNPYTIHDKVQDPSGLEMTQIELSTLLINTTIITRTVFTVSQDRLYLGANANDSVSFATELDFNTPYFAISESERITIDIPEIISIPADDFAIVE